MTALIQFSPLELLLREERRKGWNGFNGAKRDRLEILADIVLSCRKPKVKTKIMYANNLNYTQLQDYLRQLTSRGLLEQENRRYVTTEKGIVFFNLFAGIRSMLFDGEP